MQGDDDDDDDDVLTMSKRMMNDDDDDDDDVDRVQAAGAEGWTIVEAASLSQPSGFPRIAPG